MKDLLESIGFCVMIVILGWLYCMATPDQMSGECDWAQQELNNFESVAVIGSQANK